MNSLSQHYTLSPLHSTFVSSAWSTLNVSREQNIVHVTIAKTGTRTLRALMRFDGILFPECHVYPSTHRFCQLHNVSCTSSVRCLQGRRVLLTAPIPSSHRVVTMVRDPIERLRSEYAMLYKIFVQSNLTFADTADQEHKWNWQVRILSGRICCRLDGQQSLREIKHRVDIGELFIGVFETYAESVRLLWKWMGHPISQHFDDSIQKIKKRSRVTTSNHSKPVIDNVTRMRLIQHNQLDYNLLIFARHMLIYLKNHKSEL
jgi:hypothetical protein